MSKDTTKNETVAPESKLLGDLAAVLGFDATKHPRATPDIFQEVVKEIADERAAKAKEAARALTLQAVTEAEAWNKLEKQFESEKAKFLKNFGKTLNKIKALANGGTEPTEESEKTE